MQRISCPYKPRSRDPTLIFGPVDICTVKLNHGPPVGLCLDSNEDRGAAEHYANLHQMGIWSRKCDVVFFKEISDYGIIIKQSDDPSKPGTSKSGPSNLDHAQTP